MLSTYFEVDIRTIERYVSDNIDELSANGYEIVKGKRLKNFINEIEKLDVPDINVGNISNRTSQLAIFDFQSFLDLANDVSRKSTGKEFKASSVGASKIDKELLHKIMEAILNETFDTDEELKLEIYNAIN